MFFRRSLPLLLLATLSTLLVFTVLRRPSWRNVSQTIGLGEAGPTEAEIASGENILPDLRQNRPKMMVNGTQNDNYTSPYSLGKTKPPGSNYTRALVVASMRSEDTEWVEDRLGDMINSSLLSPRIYVVDSKTAKLRVAKNKGHEVMVYLSYIIENWDALPDINIFMHAHQYAWHNNVVLDNDAAQMVRYLSPERVTREGYMSLRCHWEPGCPDWLHPGATELDLEKKEEVILANTWAEVFPLDPIPQVLAQPCCAQFAVSRERILAIPKQRYVQLRDWITRTDLSDYLSGRIFEYTWQFIFRASPVYCPSQAACYCDGYGLCFGSDFALTEYLDLTLDLNELKEDLEAWEEAADAIEVYRKHSKNGKIPDDAMLKVPKVGEGELLRKKIKVAKDELLKRKTEAVEKGQDPAQRAMEAGRNWKKGDGF